MLDLSAVFQSHPDIVLVVDRDVINHRQPVSVPELCQRLSAPQVFQVRFDLVLSCRALGNQVGDLDVSGFCLIEPGYQGIVAFLVIGLIEGDVSVLLDALLNELGTDVDLRFQIRKLTLKSCDVEIPYDLLFRDDLSKTDIKKLKEVATSLLQKIKLKIAEFDHWTDKQETKAAIDNLIRDTLWAELPECYDEVSISMYRQKIYEYVYTRYRGVA